MAGLKYPLGESMADQLRARSRRPLDEITVETCAAGALHREDIAIDAETLRLQAKVARGTGRLQLAENLERAAEMVAMPAELIFEIYDMLRPGRARNQAELLAIAERLRRDYGAEKLPRLIEDAAAVYEQRQLFRPRYK